MKFAMLLTSLAFASPAHAATKYECTGVNVGVPTEIDFFEGGYGYDATYAYFQDGKNISSGYAHGGSFSECGSRTDPCNMITITNYDVSNPNLSFIMITNMGTKTGEGSLSVYDHGYEAGKTAEVKLSCVLKKF